MGTGSVPGVRLRPESGGEAGDCLPLSGARGGTAAPGALSCGVGGSGLHPPDQGDQGDQGDQAGALRKVTGSDLLERTILCQCREWVERGSH